jgi:hypothetical protein
VAALLAIACAFLVGLVVGTFVGATYLARPDPGPVAQHAPTGEEKKTPPTEEKKGTLPEEKPPTEQPPMVPPADTTEAPKKVTSKLGQLTADIINKNVRTDPPPTPGAQANAPKQLVGKWAGVIEPDFSQMEKLGLQVPPEVRQKARMPFQFICSPEYKIKIGMAGVLFPFELQAGVKEWTGTKLEGSGVTEFVTTADSCRFTMREKKGPDVEFRAIDDFRAVDAMDRAMTYSIRRVGDELEVELTEASSTRGQPLQTVPVKIRGRLRPAE